jgi:hypothetical protein
LLKTAFGGFVPSSFPVDVGVILAVDDILDHFPVYTGNTYLISAVQSFPDSNNTHPPSYAAKPLNFYNPLLLFFLISAAAAKPLALKVKV